MRHIISRHWKRILAQLAALAVVSSYVACSDVGFSTVQQDEKQLEQETFKTIKPVLAVRGIACLMCHADVRANIITDFGYGNSWFLGGSGATIDNESWFNNYVSTWQTTLKIEGSVFVPNATIPSNIQNSMGLGAQPPLSIVDMMTTPYTVNNDWDQKPENTVSSMDKHIVPEVGMAKVNGKSQVTIRAPSEAEILSLAPDLLISADTSMFTRLKSSAAVQLVKKSGMGGVTYSMNDEAQTLECSNADIVVKGTLYLRNLNVNAAKGCRLYVSGSVFIEGAITYVGAGENPNLQITSANAIVMGIGKPQLIHRLLEDSRGVQIASSRPYSERAQQTVDEATAIGVLKDASETYATMANDFQGNPRASINFSSLLLNAPLVHSRYLGEVQGTIISEAALFALGEFHFSFDPVFTKVDVLPRLKQAILIAQ